jgi:superfamily II DNA or RNA helicase
MGVDLFDWKSLSLEDLQWAYEGVSFPQEPHRHQYISLAFAADKKRVAFWHDVGTGKTYAAYLTARQWGQGKLLVICPKSAIGSWVRDAKVMGLTYQIISGETEERREKIKQDQQVSIVQYEWLKTIYAKFYSSGYEVFMKNIKPEDIDRMAENYPDYKVEEDKLGKGYYTLWKPKGKSWNIAMDLFNQDFPCVIWDEIHRCGNEESLQTKICLQLSRRAIFGIGLSGTPVDKGLLDLFDIHQVLDLGATFGNSFYAFRNANFEKDGFDWKVKPDRKQHVLDKWARSSLSFDRSECQDLPPSQEVPLILQPSEEFLKLEERVVLRKAIRVAGCKDIFSLPSAAATKMKQLTDGFIYLGDKTYRLKENPKLDATLELLECGKKTIIHHDYVEAGEIMEETFKKAKIPFVRFRGGQTVEERLELEHQFQLHSNIQVAISQSAGAEGWDGFAAEITILWDVIPSPRLRKQCIGRMLRDGQENETVIIEFMIQGSINEETKLNQDGRRSEVEEYMAYVQKYNERQKVGV